jgi:hypothetical protein
MRHGLDMAYLHHDGFCGGRWGGWFRSSGGEQRGCQDCGDQDGYYQLLHGFLLGGNF